MSMYPLVIKRDGEKEPFSVINIARVITTAGLTPAEAKTVAEHIAKWASSLNRPEITSLEIRDYLIPVLAEVNKNAADLYSWYEQTKG